MLFSRFFKIIKTLVIYKISHQYLTCVATADTCQIWMWVKESNRYLHNIKNVLKNKTNKQSSSKPHPWTPENSHKAYESHAVECCYNAVQYCKILITLIITGTEAQYQSDAGSTKDTPYLTLTGELWTVFCEYLGENWRRYNGTTLYLVSLSHPMRHASCRYLSQMF